MFKGLKGKFKKEAKQKAAQVSADILRKREFVKSKFYPMLVEQSKSVDDAKIICQVLQSSIQTAFNKQMLTQKLDSLGLEGMVAKDADYDKYRAVLNLLETETIADALDIIMGMSPAIDGFIREEMVGRKLDSIKTNFL